MPERMCPVVRKSGKRKPAFTRWLLFSLLLLVPSVGLFCWQWTSPEGIPAPSRATDVGQPELEPVRPFRTQSSFSNSLRSIPNPRFGELPHSDPFSANLSREMIAAQGDPFILAYVSGTREGKLVVKERSASVVTLGPQVPQIRGAYVAGQDLLRQIDLGLGGSMTHFLSNALPASKSIAQTSAEDLELGDENPFLKALAASEVAQPSEKVTEKAAESTPPTAPKEETPPPPPKETPPAKAAIAGSGPVTTLRPYTLLRVEAGGILRSFAVSRPRENVLESAEMGIQDFNVFSFTDPAEYPMSMTAADLNGDGYADLAVHIPHSGAIRIWNGSAEGKFSEQLRIQASRFPSSLVAADFDRDGAIDLAISAVGTGLVTVLYGDGGRSFERFRVYWSDSYRDYIATTENPRTGSLELTGMTFAQQGQVLIDFTRPEGTASDRRLEFSPALASEVSTFKGRSARLQGVLLNSRLSVNVDNRNGQMVSVLNVAAGADVYVVVGDLTVRGNLDVGLAVPIR